MLLTFFSWNVTSSHPSLTFMSLLGTVWVHICPQVPPHASFAIIYLLGTHLWLLCHFITQIFDFKVISRHPSLSCMAPFGFISDLKCHPMHHSAWHPSITSTHLSHSTHLWVLYFGLNRWLFCDTVMPPIFNFCVIAWQLWYTACTHP